jgi:hypothetical protein
MRTINKTFGFIALCVLGLGLLSIPASGLASFEVQGQDPAEKPAGAAAAKPAEAATVRVVLLTDGHIVKGLVREEEAAVVVTQPAGVMRFPRRRIDNVFGSIQEVYKYKLEQLPENDFDERMKLARWCLEQKMETEAREQLRAVMELSPKHLQAKAMLVSLDQAQARREMQKLDPEVRQTAAVESRLNSSSGERPGSLDASVIQGARRGMGISDIPVIFDLPTSQAVKRADEFARFVHPVLQLYCAKCHNERYDGGFQLIQIRNRKDQTRETLRANLDSTLKLIDRDSPPRSELLASSLRPHGNGKNTRPIFQGSNDGSYRILAAWANNLRVRKTTDSQAPARVVSTQETGEAFAADRTRISRDRGILPPLPQASGFPLDAGVSRPARDEAGRNMRPEAEGGPDEFPIPFAISGKKPKLASGPAVPPPVVKPPAPRGPSILPKSGEPTADPDGMADLADPAAKKKPRKPLKLDPAILERALQLRNQNR